ncbi:Crp/Fnr family transcriptional regulator [Undibacterium sp. FT79W]|jgi:CRP-like cAMP-binding protein|nr:MULTISPECIES: Crp/Fnr family transcriptional regulator [unclassified Undibacterium]MBC3877766.1 Crp/Fnr family transcriptional regulator [Undibacterium sp. FT79W]MBC3928705.1 Crp/Fnr family transcriptional regulator [Undibacterium sp. CY21W]MBY0570920.1 Crp/Fnr family transcriptional regulator [Burkholderiaceae bacterium]
MANIKSELKQGLAKTMWAHMLAPDHVQKVEDEIIERFIPAGGYVCRKGDPVDHWMGVLDGFLKMSSISPEGKTVTFSCMLAGGWFGEGSLLKTEPRRYDVVALRDTRVAYMPRSTFTFLLDNSIPFNRFLLHQLNERLGLFISLVEYDRMLDPDTRVARCLAAMFNPYLNPGSSMQLQISQEEIGYISSVSRQRANQALQLLEKKQLLSVDYGGITILNLEGLRRYPEPVVA